MHDDISLPRRVGRALGIAITFLLVVITLAGCAPGPTGYTAAGGLWRPDYGYADKAIGDDEYSIVVTGTPRTSNARMADIALLRAAELSKSQARTHFLVLIQRADQVTRRESIPAPVWVGALILVPVGETQPIYEPHLVLIIRLLPNDAPRPDNAIEAAAVIAEVGARLGTPVGS